MPCAINPSIYEEVEKFSLLFQTADPFPHIVVDNFLNESLANALIKDFPKTSFMHLYEHYFFTNKYALSFWSDISDSFSLLYQDLLSDQFQSFIKVVSGDDLFMDAKY